MCSQNSPWPHIALVAIRVSLVVMPAGTANYGRGTLSHRTSLLPWRMVDGLFLGTEEVLPHPSGLHTATAMQRNGSDEGESGSACSLRTM